MLMLIIVRNGLTLYAVFKENPMEDGSALTMAAITPVAVAIY